MSANASMLIFGMERILTMLTFTFKRYFVKYRLFHVQVGSLDPFLDPITFLALFHLIEIFICVTNVYEFE